MLKVQISSTWGMLGGRGCAAFWEKCSGAASLNVHLQCEVREEQERKRFSLLWAMENCVKINCFALRTKVIAVIVRMATDARYFHEFTTRKLVGSDGSRLVLRLLTWVGRIVAVSGVVLVAVIANRTIVGVLLMRTAIVVLSWIAILIVVAALSTVARTKQQ